MDAFDALFAQGLADYQLSFECVAGTVQLRFAADGSRLHAILGSGNWDARIRERGPEVLPLITTTVQIVVQTDRQVSARYRASECLALFESMWPCNGTFSRILRGVTERKHYPLPEPGIPGEGGKSMTAQGQTKKDGSHSHDRHR